MTPAMSALTASPIRSTDQLLMARTSPPFQFSDSWSTAAVRPNSDTLPENSSEIRV